MVLPGWLRAFSRVMSKSHRGIVPQARVKAGAAPVKGRPRRPIGPVVPLDPNLCRPSGKERDWHTYEDKLVGRGELSWMLRDPDLFQTRCLGPKGGRPAYSPAALAVCTVMRAAGALDWRSTEGRVRDLARLSGWDGPTPDRATMARKAADPQVTAAVEAFFIAHGNRASRRAGPVIILVDSTGVTLCGPGGYLRDKHKDPRRGKYHILHLATDAQTGEILSFELTESTRCVKPGDHNDGLECDCPKIGDSPVAGRMLQRLASAGIQVDALVGDGAYSGSPLRAVAQEVGARVIAPLPVNAGYQPESRPGAADRNNQVMQERHLGAAEWKDRVGYHVRSSVEADIGAFKATLGDKIRSKHIGTARAEIAARVGLRNYWMN